MPQYVVAPPPKSQYELERDARIKRNEEYMLSIGINPYSDGYMKLRTPKSKRHRKRVRVVDDLSDDRTSEDLPILSPWNTKNVSQSSYDISSSFVIASILHAASVII